MGSVWRQDTKSSLGSIKITTAAPVGTFFGTRFIAVIVAKKRDTHYNPRRAVINFIHNTYSPEDASVTQTLVSKVMSRWPNESVMKNDLDFDSQHQVF